MSSGLCVGSPRLSSLAPALVAGLALVVACFDSDEKAVPLSTPAVTTGGVVPSTTSSSSGGSSSSSGTPDVTCRDAIDCVIGCAAELQASKLPETDLTCFLKCEPDLTVGEALHLFYLTECVTNKCIDQGACDVLVPTETSGSSSSSDGGSSSSGGSSGTTDTGGSSSEAGGPMNPCQDCILTNMLDKNPGGECQALADACV